MKGSTAYQAEYGADQEDHKYSRVSPRRSQVIVDVARFERRNEVKEQNCSD